MPSDEKKTLKDADIKTDHVRGRRRFMRLMASGGVAGVAGSFAPQGAIAQTGDGDNGAWHDTAECPRGQGGVVTGRNDADNGSLTDTGNRGRGRPYC